VKSIEPIHIGGKERMGGKVTGGQEELRRGGVKSSATKVVIL
jgi:hypothetical protein